MSESNINTVPPTAASDTPAVTDNSPAARNTEALDASTSARKVGKSKSANSNSGESKSAKAESKAASRNAAYRAYKDMLVAKVLALGALLQTFEHGRKGPLAFRLNATGQAMAINSPEFRSLVAFVADLPAKDKAVTDVVGLIEVRAKYAPLVAANIAHGIAVRELNGGRTVLVHLGMGHVMRCGEDGRWSPVPNSTDGILFLDEEDFEAITRAELLAAVHERPETFPVLRSVLLDQLPPPSGLLTYRETQAIVLAQVITVFAGPFSNGRPAFMLLGPTGCGKTVTQRGLAIIVQGPSANTTGSTSADRVMKDIAATACNSSFIARDDLNQLPNGAVDALLRLCTGTRFKVATFFETLQLETYFPRAALCLSAFQPDWLTREDLANRLMIVRFAKPEESSITEKDRLAAIVRARPAIWVEILAALASWTQPLPEHQAISRFDDWERALMPIMDRAGFGEAFRSALAKMPAERVAVMVSGNPFQQALYAIATGPSGGQWITAAKIVDLMASGFGATASEHEVHTATGTLVRDPRSLASMLSRVMTEGSAVVNVSRSEHPAHNNTYLYRITPKIPLPPVPVLGVDILPLRTLVEPSPAASVQPASGASPQATTSGPDAQAAPPSTPAAAMPQANTPLAGANPVVSAAQPATTPAVQATSIANASRSAQWAAPTSEEVRRRLPPSIAQILSGLEHAPDFIVRRRDGGVDAVLPLRCPLCFQRVRDGAASEDSFWNDDIKQIENRAARIDLDDLVLECSEPACDAYRGLEPAKWIRELTDFTPEEVPQLLAAAAIPVSVEPAFPAEPTTTAPTPAPTADGASMLPTVSAAMPASIEPTAEFDDGPCFDCGTWGCTNPAHACPLCGRTSCQQNHTELWE